MTPWIFLSIVLAVLVALALLRTASYLLFRWSQNHIGKIRLRYFRANEPEFADFLEWWNKERGVPFPASDEEVLKAREGFEIRKATLEMRELAENAEKRKAWLRG